MRYAAYAEHGAAENRGEAANRVDNVIATGSALIDVVEGHGRAFSLDGPRGNAFHTRSRECAENAWAQICKAD